MVPIKCLHCGLNNFGDAVECRRCMRPMSSELFTPATGLPPCAAIETLSPQSFPLPVAVMPPPKSSRLPSAPLVVSLLTILLLFVFVGSYTPGRIDMLAQYTFVGELTETSLWVIGLMIVLAMRYRQSLSSLDEPWSGESHRLDGFLMIPVAGLVRELLIRLAMIIEEFRLAGDLTAIPIHRNGVPGQLDFGPVLMMEICMNSLLAILMMITLSGFVRKSPSLPKLFIWLMGAEFLVSLIDSTMVYQLMSGVTIDTQAGARPLIPDPTTPDVLILLSVVLNRIIRVGYFRVSKRVKATFGIEEFA